MEKVVLAAQRGADKAQAEHAWLGFPYAVFKKYADDEGSRLAALITYYSFLSLFPMAIMFMFSLSVLFHDDPAARNAFVSEIVPAEYSGAVLSGYDALPSGGAPLAIALIGLLLTATGLVFSIYGAFNQIWAVPYRHRFGFFPRYLRVLAMVLVLGLAAMGIAGLGVATGSLSSVPVLSPLLWTGGTLAIAFGVLLAATWTLTARYLGFSQIWLGSLLGACSATAILAIGGPLLRNLVSGSEPIYGTFAAIVGAFALIFLAAQAIIFGVEASAVRGWQLWPRGLDINLLFPADRRALSLLAHMDERMPSAETTVTFDARGNEDPRREHLSSMDRRQPGEPRSPYKE